MQNVSTTGALSCLDIISDIPQEWTPQAERQNIVLANSPGEQVGSKMLTSSTVERRRAKLEVPLVAKPPKQLGSMFCGSFGQLGTISQWRDFKA